jgi:hypothetical protein
MAIGLAYLTAVPFLDGASPSVVYQISAPSVWHLKNISVPLATVPEGWLAVGSATGSGAPAPLQASSMTEKAAAKSAAHPQSLCFCFISLSP